MTNLPFFDFSASISNRFEQDPQLTSTNYNYGAMGQKEESNKAMMDHIKGIFDDSASEEAPEDQFFRADDSRAFPPGLILPKPVFYSKDQFSPLLPQYGTNQNKGYESTTQNEPTFEPLKTSSPPFMTNFTWLNQKTAGPNSFYNVQVNDDIFLIERIESILPQISASHDPYCPFCLKYIDLKKINFQNVSAYYSKTTKKHYLTHFDCYYKAKDRTFNIKSLTEVPAAKINVGEQAPDLSQYVRRDRKIHFISLEALHPISSYLHCKIEKSATAIEDPQQGKQVLYYNFDKKSTSIYEPNAHVILYPEFRCHLTIASCPSNEEPYTFEFLVALPNLTLETPEKSIECVHTQNGNQLRLGFQVSLDIDGRVTKNLNYKIAVPDRPNMQEPAKILILKYLLLALPLLRKPTKIPEIQAVDGKIIEEEEGSLSPKHENKRRPKIFQEISSLGKDDISSFSTDDLTADQWLTTHDSNSKRKDKKSQSEKIPQTTWAQGAVKGFYSPATEKSGGGPMQISKASDYSLNFPSSQSYSCSNLDDSLNQSRTTQYLSFLPNYENDESKFSDVPFKLSDYQGKLFELSKQPSGSRAIQNFIPKANSLELDVIIFELKPHLTDVLLDPYANHMFQTLMHHSSPTQRITLLSNIIPLIPQVACHKKGTHSLQAIISIIKGDEEEQLFETSLSEYIVELSKDPYGTHFIQKLVASLSLERIGGVFKSIMNGFIELSKHSYGLCVLKSLVNKIEKDADKKKTVVEFVAQNLDELIEDGFGNYAIQHIFEVYKQDCTAICEEIMARILLYSNQKFSSNVVEKCLETASAENRRRLIEAIIKNEKLIEMMTNKYGNFVLLKAYNLAADREKKVLQTALQKSFTKIHSSKYKSRWNSFFEECSKKSNEISAKILNKQPKNSKEPLSAEDKKKGSGGSEEDNDDSLDGSNRKFSGRKKNKLPSHFAPKTNQVEIERAKNRKFSAPITALKFSTNFS